MTMDSLTRSIYQQYIVEMLSFTRQVVYITIS